MKRSRACEDLRALESAPPHSNNLNSLTGQPPRGLKRPKRHNEMVDCDIEELSNDNFLAAIGVGAPDAAADALQFVLGMKANFERRRSSSGFDECLPPIRRNSRNMVVECDAAMQFKQKLQLAESAGDAPEAASDIICSRRFHQRETHCMDPLHPFEVSFYRLSINPNS